MKSVVICGSAKFKTEMSNFVEKLEKLGVVVYGLYSRKESKDEWDNLSEDYKKFVALGSTHAHFYKIRMADVVFVYNPNGYIGNGATMEIGFAVAVDKPIYALHSDDQEICRNVLFSGIINTPEELVKKL